MLLTALLIICAVYAVIMFSVQGVLRKRHQKQYAKILVSLEEQPPEKENINISQAENEETKKRLNQLKEHLGNGLITKEEYKVRRKELLKDKK